VRSIVSHLAHLLTEAVLGAAGLALFVIVVLAWRLAAGPVDVTWLAERLAPSLVGGGAHLTVGAAYLVWEGFREGQQPVDIRVREARLTDAQGGVVAVVPAARVTLAPGSLVHGRILPRTIAVTGARLNIARDASGAVRLELGGNPAQAAPGRVAGGGAGELVRELVRAPRPGDLLPWAGQLRRIRVQDAQVTVDDAQLGTRWTSPIADLLLQRQPDGGISGDARLAIEVGEVRSAIAVTARLDAAGTRLHATATPVDLARLAAAMHGFSAPPAMAAVLAGIALAPAWSFDATLDPALQPIEATLDVTTEAGRVALPRGALALGSAEILARYAHGALEVVSRATVRPLDGAGETVEAAAHARFTRGQAIEGGFDLALGEVPMRELAQLWPEGTGGGARPWVTQNITAGWARDALVSGAVTIPADLSDATVTRLVGGVRGDDLTAWWLRPVPPITGAHALVTIEGTDALTVRVLDGRQAGLVIHGGSVRVTGIEKPHQFGAIDAHIVGPVRDALAVLNHPRLGLAKKLPLPIEQPSGQADARLTAFIPLEDRVSFDDITIGSRVHLTALHLADVVDGRDLTRGDVQLRVDTQGLAAEGRAAIGGLETSLKLAMDFRAGPPGEVTQRASVTAPATIAQLQGFGLPATTVASGRAVVSAEYEERRNGEASARLAADLRDTVFATPVGWSKAAGEPGHAEAELLLRAGKIRSVERVRAHAPGLAVEGRAELGSGGSVLRLSRIEIGRTRARGEVAFAGARDRRTRVSLQGEVLDLSGWFRSVDKREAEAPAPARDDTPGPAWSARVGFDRVLLSPKRDLTAVRLSADDDGRHITRAELSAATPTALQASIVPEAGGRRLRVNAADAGVALTALGIADNIAGGRFAVDGRYDDARAGSPLSGTATLSAFRVTDAPLAARLLKAATLYGVVDLLRGPGVGFGRAVVPFRWQDRVLQLKSARATSPSLGLTAQGSVDFPRRRLDLRGTVVPAWLFNQLPGRLPLVGRLFSPEKGGGVFAATYTIRGPIDDPAVAVDPLSVLAPGIVRDLFR
jgi:hypothetical protein